LRRIWSIWIRWDQRFFWIHLRNRKTLQRPRRQFLHAPTLEEMSNRKYIHLHLSRVNFGLVEAKINGKNKFTTMKKLYQNKTTGNLAYILPKSWKKWRVKEFETPEEMVEYMQSLKISVFNCFSEHRIGKAVSYNQYNLSTAKSDWR